MLVILTCFTACKPKLKNGTVVTNAAGDVYAAVTKEDGGIARDEAGNLLVLVTDKNGKNVKGENGEYLTNPVALKHALVIGRQVECKTYSVTIPDGWSDAYSLNGLSIKKDNTKDALVIETKDKSLDNAMGDVAQLMSIMKTTYPDAVGENKSVKLGDIDARFVSTFVPDAGESPSYLAYYFFKQGANVYSCRITSDRDLSNDLDEFNNIITSISFR